MWAHKYFYLYNLTLQVVVYNGPNHLSLSETSLQIVASFSFGSFHYRDAQVIRS